MRPPTPEELDEDRKELPAEGMMFIGDKGKILAGFRVENPRLIPERRMSGLCGAAGAAARAARTRRSFRRDCASGSRPARAARNRPAVSSMPARSPRP